MKKQKLNFRTTSFASLLLIAMFISNIHSATAQKETPENKLLKYELSIDLVPLIDQGQFVTIYFKINRYKEDQLKGAYRIGVSKGTYLKYKIDQSSLLENQSSSYVTVSHFESVLYFGYEKYIKIGSVLTYYGLDINGRYFVDHHTPQNYTDDQELISLGVCPFWGIKHYIYKSRVSLAFEVGWESSFGKNTNQYDGNVFYGTQSDFRLPYSFTINYHF